MHFELREALRLIVSNSEVLRAYGVIESDAVRRILEGDRAIEVEDAPNVLESWLASPLCFELAKIIRRTSNCEIEPLELAEKILAEAGENSFFQLSVGGKGFINAIPNAPCLLRFLEGMQQASLSQLYGSPFVVADNPVAVERSDVTIDRDAVLSELRCSRKDDSSQRFLESISAEVKIDWPILAQLLAMQRDPEIEADAFRKGLFGSQNVSWYFNYFERCLDTALTQLGAPNEQTLDEHLLPRSLELSENSCAEYSTDYVDIAYGRAIRLMVTFRRTYQRALRGNDAGLLMLLARDLAASFFGLYNLPEIRAMLHPSATAKTDLLAVVFHGLGSCLRPSISSLKSTKIL